MKNKRISDLDLNILCLKNLYTKAFKYGYRHKKFSPYQNKPNPRFQIFIFQFWNSVLKIIRI